MQPCFQAKVRWEGWFEQFDDRTDMAFDNMVMDLNGNISGGGSDDVGEFTINGMDNGTDEITFIKQYKGAHAVHYKGAFDGKKIWGEWEIPGN